MEYLMLPKTHLSHICFSDFEQLTLKKNEMFFNESMEELRTFCEDVLQDFELWGMHLPIPHLNTHVENDENLISDDLWSKHNVNQNIPELIFYWSFRITTLAYFGSEFLPSLVSFLSLVILVQFFCEAVTGQVTWFTVWSVLKLFFLACRGLSFKFPNWEKHADFQSLLA